MLTVEHMKDPMHNGPKRLTARHWLAVGAAAFTIALTAAAFWLSYEHLHDVAAANGLGGQSSAARAWAWPATVDMFIIVGELLILRASLRGTVDPWAIGLTASGSIGSIALNVAGVGTDAAPLEYVVAAVPPVAALLAFGALMRQVHEAIAGHVDSQQAAPEVTAQRMPRTLAPVVTSPPALPDPLPFAWDDYVTTQMTSEVTTSLPAATHRQVVTEVVTLTPADLRKRAQKLNRKVVIDTGRPVTIERLRTELGLSRRDATELRREIVEEKRS